MISLGGVELNNALEWVERYSQARTVGTSRRTLAGRLRLTAQRLVGGKPITLEATQDHGWLDRNQLRAVEDMALDPTGVYTLVFGSESYQVAFRHAEAPVVSFRPLVHRTEDAAEDQFVGQIKLIVL